MTDNAEKNRSQTPEHSGQQQPKNPQDISKKNPSQDNVKENVNHFSGFTPIFSFALSLWPGSEVGWEPQFP